ncbi:hypothetical protein KUCAC02_021489, partial [Chaenocephalus aceratus]
FCLLCDVRLQRVYYQSSVLNPAAHWEMRPVKLIPQLKEAEHRRDSEDYLVFFDPSEGDVALQISVWPAARSGRPSCGYLFPVGVTSDR